MACWTYLLAGPLKFPIIMSYSKNSVPYGYLLCVTNNRSLYMT